MKHVVMLGAAIVASTALAAVTFNGTGDWPESSDVVISGAVTVDESHLREFESWTSVTFADKNAKLRLENTVTPTTLSAPVSGEGTFEVSGSAGLTITSDNSGLTGDGRFYIENSIINVANENALGSTKPCRFYWGEKGSLSFTTTDGVLTNKVPITYDGVSATGYRIYLGSPTTSENVVQNAHFKALTGGSTQGQAVMFQNNFEFNKGTFGSDSANVDVYCRALEGACVRFSGCTLGVQEGRGIYLIGSGGQGGTYHLAPKSMSMKRLAIGNGVKVVCDKEDALRGTEELYFYVIAEQSGYLDLNGFDQTVPSIKPQEKSSESNAKYAVVHSESSATFTVEASADASTMLEFSGAASFRYRGTAVNTFARRVSNTTGTLYVTSGTQAFEYGAGWNGDVTVDGGVLRISSANDLPNGTARLILSDQGKLDLRADVYVGSFNVDGEELDPGDYSKTTLAEAGYPNRIDGDGVLHVQGTAREWKGWKSARGGTAYVPADMTVTIADEDVEDVAAVNKIFFGLGSTVSCGNSTVPLALSARLSGSGEFRIVDSAGVTILGDNSGLSTPGAFYISNSPVVVSNEFGLGSAKTGTTTVYWGDRGSLKFGCESGYFTNNVAIRYDGTTATNYRIYFGSSSPDEYLVQNASFMHMSGGTNKGRYLVLTNNVMFTAGEFGSESGTLYTRYEGEGEYGVVGSASLSFKDANTTWNLVGQGSTCHLAPTSVVRPFKQLALISPGIRVICDGPNVLGGETPIKFTLNETNPDVLDLNGFDQELPKLLNQGESGYAIVTSSVPATVWLSGTADATNILRFDGSADVNYVGTGMLSFDGFVSPTTGKLEIGSGTCLFANNAGWGGTNIVISGGTLRIAKTAEDTVFAPSTKQEGVTLHVIGGDLSLDDGVRVVVHTVNGAEDLPGRGWYGGAAAQAKGLVDKDHVLPWISGSGLLRILNVGPRGLMLLFK